MTVHATLTSPSGRSIRVPGFHDGDETWIVRVAFDEKGVWQLRTTAQPANDQLRVERTIEVIDSNSHGPLRPVATRVAKPFAGKAQTPPKLNLAAADGTPFFHAGDTCYPLLAIDRDTQRLPYLRRRSGQGFSHIRFQACRIDSRYPELWPWGGTPRRPDFDRFNPAYFRRMDQLMRDLREHGLGAEIILESFYMEPTRDRLVWTDEREQAWLRTLIARYAAFDNLLYWTICNEFETYPDGSYRLDVPGDIDWVNRSAAFVKSIDRYGHPVTVHPYMGVGEYLSYFGASPNIDLILLQEHGNEEVRVALSVSDGSGTGLEQKILIARALGKPVVVAEYRYEWDGVTMRGANSTTDLQRRHTWRIVMGGGHFSAGFRSTVFNFTGMRFDIENGGRPGAEQISALIRFFKQRTRFELLEPRPDLVSAPNLCLRGKNEWVVYFPFGGEATVDLADDPETYRAVWLDTVSGKSVNGPPLQGGARRTIAAPFPEAVLHLNARDDRAE